MKHYLMNTKEFGRGLYATDEIPANTLLFTAELLVFNPEDTVKVNETDLKWYTFKYNETQDCLVLGDGEIFNHSDSPNVSYKLIEYDGRKVMAFHTTRPVETHEQLFIDYSADVQIETKNYTKNMI